MTACTHVVHGDATTGRTLCGRVASTVRKVVVYTLPGAEEYCRGVRGNQTIIPCQMCAGRVVAVVFGSS